MRGTQRLLSVVPEAVRGFFGFLEGTLGMKLSSGNEGKSAYMTLNGDCPVDVKGELENLGRTALDWLGITLKEGGKAGIDEFLHYKTVTIA